MMKPIMMIFGEIIRSKWLRYVIAGFVIFIVLFESNYSDRYYPGVIIAGVHVGGRTHDDVLQEFKAKADSLSKNGLDLVFEKKTGRTEINIPVETAGFTPDTVVQYFSIVDLEGDISAAYDWGRKGSALRRLKEQFYSIPGKEFNSGISPHEEAIKSLLSRETTALFTEKVPAQFSFINDQLVIIPEKEGDSVDIDEVVGVILERVSAFEIEPIVFNVRSEIPSATEEKLRPFLGQVKEFAKTANVNLRYKSSKWKVSGKTLATWLVLKSDYELAIDNKKLEEFLVRNVAPLVNNPVQNSRFEMIDGELIEISPGKAGNMVNIAKVTETIHEIVPRIQRSFLSAYAGLIINSSEINYNSKDNTIDVPIEIIKVEPQVTKETIDQYKIKDLLGYAETSFEGSSADRKHNIRNGVSKLTGTLIAPGQEFSTIATLGPVTEEAGFVKEFVIREVRNVKELGGGLCQLGSTLFNTILDAALPVTERINHKYTIKYYVTGLDATIYGPHPDLRFVNDTGNWLLLQGKVFGNKVAFELYGVADGRTSEVSKPILSNPVPVPPTRYVMTDELAKGETQCNTGTKEGITANATYTITYPDGTVKQRNFRSVYEAWPEVCLVGTG